MTTITFFPANTERGITHLRKYLQEHARTDFQTLGKDDWVTLALGNMRSLLSAYEEIERLRASLSAADRYAVHRDDRCVSTEHPEQCYCGFAEWREAADVALVGDHRETG